MKLRCLSIGKSSPRFIDDAVKEYSSRMGKYVSFDWVLLTPVKNATRLPAAELKKREGQAMLKTLHPKDFVIILDEKGKSYTSREFAAYLEQLTHRSIKQVVFVIGGAYGFSQEMYERANAKLCLSDMTFSHQLIRVIFAEQLFRAYSIINNDPYHND